MPGTGNPGNPYVINFDGSEVSGQGIGWQNNQLGVRIVPGGGLEFDQGGALQTTSVLPPDLGRADVAHLEARTQDVIGGSIGAGFLIKPPDLLRSFQWGLQAGLDFMHVPVRFLSDGSPVVRISETMERSTRNPIEHVEDQDAHVWGITNTKPGLDYFHRLGEDMGMPANVGPNGSRAGWFGYLEHGQLGLTNLSDVFREVGGRIVLVLDLRFPARDGSGNFPATTPPWRLDYFLNQVKNMILAFGLTNSVIVTSTEVEVPSAGSPNPRRVLEFFQTAGIRVGPYLETQAAADAHPPNATWPAEWTWVFLSRAIDRATLQGYVNRAAPLPKLHVILFVVTRQYLKTELVNLPGGIGAKGVISADSRYYSGDGGLYRTDQLKNATIKHGLLAPGTESLNRMSWDQRGVGKVGLDGMWLGQPVQRDSRSTTAYVNQGYLCPHPAPNNGGLDIGIGFDQLPPPGGSGWAALAFGIARDHGFKDRPVGSPPDDTNYPYDSGYVMLVDSNGGVLLFAYDRGSGTNLTPSPTPAPYGAPKPIGHAQNTDRRRGVPMYFRIGWNPNGLKISQITAIGDPNTGPVVIQSTVQIAKDYRGGYLYFGRFSQTDVAWDCFFDKATVLYNGAPPFGP